MSKIVLSAISVVTLAIAALGYQGYRNNEAAKVEETERLLVPYRAMLSAVRHKLKDPDSAKFRNVFYNPRTKVGCGWLNAKNSYGGYTGETQFFVSADGTVELDETKIDDATWLATCNSEGAITLEAAEKLAGRPL